MPASPRSTAAGQKRALAGIQSDLRRLNIIKTNQAKMIRQIEQLVARYNQSETLASNVKKKIDEMVAAQIKNTGG
ncbi:MAG: hypothetical protein M3P32_00395 [Chloroflexota bacterium]|nr:hypothetical protein [Chloroflexota bacterium]